MKKALITCILLSSTITLLAEPLGKAPLAAISLQAKTLTTKKDFGENWHTEWGSSDTERTRSTIIEIATRNLRSSGAKIKVEWYFVADSKGTKWVYDKGEAAIELGGGKTEKLQCESAPLDHSKLDLRMIGINQESGGKPDGWIVRVIDRDTVVAVKASSTPLKQLGESSKKLKAIIPQAE